jgi:polyphosphate kinase
MSNTEPRPETDGDQPQPPVPLPPHRYFNRALNWLEFNRRVLGEALSPRHPLLERARFIAIFSSNLDRFFMVRVSGIREQLEAGFVGPDPDGLTPAEQLVQIKLIVEELTEARQRCWCDDILPELEARGIRICDYQDLSAAERAAARKLFYEEIFPVLTPLAFDPGHPFPHISNLNLAVVINKTPGEERFARMKVPEVLPRLMPVGGALVWIEQIIVQHLDALFPGMQVVEAYPFRVTRDADVEFEDDKMPDLLLAVQHNLRRRHFGQAIRLTVDQSMPPRIVEILRENLELKPDDVYRVKRTMGLVSLSELYAIDRPDLKAAPFVPAVPAPLADASDPLAGTQAGDILMHHPFDSFLAVVDLIRAAAEDPRVLAIKQTLYRIGQDSPIVDALMEAREQGKQVTVLVELKARFDEEYNIEWATKLEDAGVHVVYGIVGLKTHCQLLLIVRKERDVLRRYVHLSTGHYNVGMAHQYTDVGLLTSDPDFGADASDLFNYLTGYSIKERYRVFAVAPANLRRRLLDLIQREIERQREMGAGAIVIKMNNLTDLQIIDALYRASMAGVRIDLIVRDVCLLRPGVPGLSDNIRVRSIVGRFLEHSRLLQFHNGGEEEIYISSADLTATNLDRQVEVLCPVQQPEHCRRLRDFLAAYLRDTANAHLLQADGSYIRPAPDQPAFDCHAWLIQQAEERSAARIVGFDEPKFYHRA